MNYAADRPKFALILPILLALGWAAVALRDQGGTDEPTAPVEPPPTLRVATLNVSFQNGDLWDLCRTLEAADADVVCLQETTDEIERALRGRFIGRYRHMWFHNHPAGGGSAVLSRRPLRNIRLLDDQPGWWPMIGADIDWAGRWVQLLNVHLTPVLPRGGDRTGNLWRLLLRTESIRLAELRGAWARLESHRPVIAAGDFNTIRSLPAGRFLASVGMVDSYAAVNPGVDAVTWRRRYGGVLWRYRIDLIYHSPALATRTSEIVPCRSSDHDLVVSELEWARGRK